MSDKELNTRTFCSLGIKKWLAENASKLGLCEATAVQRACIPPILKGVDVIGTSQTGSGKTAAFALPILQILSQDSYGIFALCMTPTRELAVQISEQFYALSSDLTLRCQVITGGEDIQAQARLILRRPHIIVGTPGRLMDHFLNSRQVIRCFQNLRFLVLDEADRLLEPSFELSDYPLSKTSSVSFEKPEAKVSCNMVDSSNVEELVELLHNEAKII